MADRTVSIAVNVAPGQDAMSPLLAKQQQAAEQLQRQLDANRAAMSQPLPMPSAQLSPERQALRDAAHLRGQTPAGVRQDAWAEAIQTAQQQQQAEQQSRLVRQARQQLGLQVEQTPEERSAAALRGQTRNIITQQLMQQTQQAPNNPFIGVASTASAFASLPGPIGSVAAGLALVTSSIGAVIGSFGGLRHSTETLIAIQQQQQAQLDRVRQTGVATSADLTRALTQQERQEFTAAQERGDPAAARAVLERAAARLRQQQQQANARRPGGPAVPGAAPGSFWGAIGTPGGSPAEMMAGLQAELDTIEADITSGVYQTAWNTPLVGGLMNLAGGSPSARRRAAARRYGVPEDMIGNPSNEAWTPEQRRQFAQQAGGPAVQATSFLATVTAALGPGGMPSMRPGAPGLEQLPNLFQSRQMDVLDIHAQVQQEAVRDARQEAQFQAQMNTWNLIYAELQRISGAPGVANPNPPVVG